MNELSLVLLHGWGHDSHCWQPLLAPLARFGKVVPLDLPGFGDAQAEGPFSLEPVLARLEQQLPPNCVLVGWSLGGMLAVQLAARLPQRVLGVVTLAANARFVAEDTYPAAMARDVNQAFNNLFAADAPAACARFQGLMAQGDDQERSLRKALRTLPSLPITAAWGEALVVLADLDNRAAYQRLRQPGLHLLGEKDALVPVACAAALRELNPTQRVQVVPGAAHALHWSCPQLVVAAIARFLTQSFPQMLAVDETPTERDPQATAPDKQQIAVSFSRAAATYDSVAHLQRQVGAQLLAAVKPTSGQVLDAGCGTGFFTTQLTSLAEQGVIALDLAEGMLRYARERAAPDAAIRWLCADAENCPLADHAVERIFSSLAFQWCADLPRLAKELFRVLAPGGQLDLATLGPHTLHELRAAWGAVDNYVHVNRFAPAEDWQEALAAAGFVAVECIQAPQQLYFATLSELTHSLKSLGAHNLNAGRARGLTGRQRINKFRAAYEDLREPQGLPATYDIWYWHARKPN